MSYYDILEVSPKASKEVIKNAYRALSKKYHPDTYKGDLKYAQEKMKEINTAYETLMDEEKRLVYDYENGYKIDPNSVVEQYAQAVRQKEEYGEEEKEQEETKKDIFKFLKDKKYITIAGVCAIFIVAVFVGNLIAGVGEKKEENKETSTKPTTTTNTTNTNNSYIPSYNPTTQNTTKTEEKKEEPKKEEETKTEEKDNSNDKQENVEEITPQEPVGES